MADRINVRIPWQRFSDTASKAAATVVMLAVIAFFMHACFASLPRLPPLLKAQVESGGDLGLLIRNKEKVEWRDCRVTLNGTYKLPVRAIEPGQAVVLKSFDFSDDRGTLFNPFSATIKRVDVDCAKAPDVARGVALDRTQ